MLLINRNNFRSYQGLSLSSVFPLTMGIILMLSQFVSVSALGDLYDEHKDLVAKNVKHWHESYKKARFNVALIILSDHERPVKIDYMKKRIEEGSQHKVTEVIHLNSKQYDQLVQEVLRLETQNQVVITTGGTGLRNDDNAVPFLRPIMYKELTGFKFVFHHETLKDAENHLKAIHPNHVYYSIMAGNPTAFQTKKGTIVYMIPGSSYATELGMNIIMQVIDKQMWNIYREKSYL